MAKDAAQVTPLLPRRLASLARQRAATPVTRYEPGQKIPDTNPIYWNQSIQTLRLQGRTSDALRMLVRKDGTFSSSVFAFVSIANSGFTLKGYDNKTHRYSPENTQVLRNIAASLNVLSNYREGYSDKLTLEQVVETSLLEVTMLSAVGLEMVLNRARLPEKLVIVPTDTLKWKAGKNGKKYPVQDGAITGGGEIDLNIPNFFYASLHHAPISAYVTPMMEPAIDATVLYQEFVEDMRRSLRKSGHSRLVVSLNAERVRAAAPPDMQNDPEKLKQWMDTVRQEYENVVKDLSPEDAIVTYDTAEIDIHDSKSVKADYTDLLTAMSGMVATSLKSHPSILGLRLQGSQSLSNTESLVFLKIAKEIQRPVADVLSRAFTLALRLYGIDGYAKFSFKEINLRPEDELEAYKTMRQQRIVELLSLGLISDEEASEMLGLGTLPEGYIPKSGTMFTRINATNLERAVSTQQDPQGRSMTPDTPSNSGN